MIGWDLWTMNFVSGPQVRSWPSTRDLAVWGQPLPGLRVLGAAGGNCILPSQVHTAQWRALQRPSASLHTSLTVPSTVTLWAPGGSGGTGDCAPVFVSCHLKVTLERVLLALQWQASAGA